MELHPILTITFTAVFANAVVARAQTGFVSAWGDNFHGQTAVPSGLSGVRQVASGYDHTYALKDDGTLVGWGMNVHGQINTPAEVSSVRDVACGFFQTFVVKHDGTLQVWGLGPTRPPGSDFTQVACGRDHRYALRVTGTLTGLGSNGLGQLGTPVGLNGVTQVACGSWHSYALKSDGSLVGWGDNELGQTSTPAVLGPVTRVVCGHNHTYALRADGSVVGWGHNAYGQIDTPASLGTVTQIACGGLHTCVRTADGGVRGWGYNGYGQVRTPANLSGFTHIACGTLHSVGLRDLVDCDSDGFDDADQVLRPESWDLNGDRILDICQSGEAFDETSPDLGTPEAGLARTHSFTDLPQWPAAAAQLIIEARGDFDATDEYLAVLIGDRVLARVFENGGTACANGRSQATVLIPRFQWTVASWDTLTRDGALTVTVVPSPAVQSTDCAGSLTIRLRYLAGDDCDNEGTMDGFQIAAGLPDANGNGRLDACEIRKGDLDLSGEIDFGDVALLLLSFGEINPPYGDLDGTGEIDFGDIGLLLLEFGPVQWP